MGAIQQILSSFRGGPVFVSYTENGTATSPLTLTAPSSITNGNLLLIFVSSEEVTTTPVAPAGFSTLLAKVGGHGTALTVFYKVASSESGSYSVTGPAYMSGSIVNLSGANASQPDVSGTPNGGSGAGATVNGITTTAAGLLFCYMGCNSSGAMGLPSGFTACGNVTGSGSREGFSCAYKTFGVGATGNVTTTTPASWLGNLMQIK